MSERVDDTGAQTRFCLCKDANRCADSVVRNRKLPIRSSNGEADSYLAIRSVIHEGVLEGIENEFCNDQAQAYGLSRGYSTCIDTPPLKWSDLRYVFDSQEGHDDGKEALQG